MYPRLLVGPVFLLAVSFLAPAVHGKAADPNESTAAVNSKGYDRASTYVNIDGAEIDAFNFNFVTQFPVAVGLTYPENAGLSLRVNLVYNSRVAYDQSVSLHRTALRVRRQNPFGLGFDLSLGRIVTTVFRGGDGPYAYVDSSGASHKLGPLVAGSSEYRTHDGSHIRAVLADGVWTVSFPDGTVQLLAHHITGPTLNDFTFGDARDGCNPLDGPTASGPCDEGFVIPDGTPPWLGWDREFVGWHVTAVHSRAAVSPTPPSYTVTYFGDDGNTSDLPFAHIIKSIVDQHGRTIHFEIDRTRGVVTRITVPAPATEGGSPRTADYLLEYESRTIAAGVVVQVLTRMSAPNVATVGEGRYVHDYGYENGRLSLVRYPSGRAVKMSYQNYDYRTRSLDPCDQQRVWIGSDGVKSIEKFLDGDTSNTAQANHRVTSFSQSQAARDFVDLGTCGYYRYDQVHTMIDPAGNKTEFRYRTPTVPEDGEDELYGLLLSEKYYGGTGGTVLKTVEYSYNDQPYDTFVWSLHNKDYDMVQKQIKTTWPDDTDQNGNPLASATQMVEDRSEFDGFGHYQKAVFSGNAVGAEGKVVVKDYASDNTQYLNGPLCPNASTLQSNWLGDVVAREEVQKKVGATETTMSRVDHGYDPIRGLRTSSVGRADLGTTVDPCTNAPSAQNGDSVTEYGFTSNGDLQSERHYVPGLGSLNAPTDVTTSYTYKYGALESTKQNALAYFDSFRIIDPASGLVTTERAHVLSSTDTSSGETTTSAYDLLGRTISIKRGTDDAIVIAYENDPVTPAPAVRLARVRSTQGASMFQTEAVDHFVYGRLDHEEKLNPDGSRAYRYATYNNADRVSFLTEWTRQSSSSGVPGTTTDYAVRTASDTYLFEEPFGRPTKVTDALGGVTTYRYFGLNKEVTTQGVALKAPALDDPASVRTWYYTDALGRLRVVAAPAVIGVAGHGPYEANGSGGKYAFDVLGRMLQADISGAVTVAPTPADRYNATATSPQTRTFSYDSIGHLTQTTTPESGTVKNLSWNALGQVTETQDALGQAWGHKHRTTYDGAGRPTRVERVVTSGATPNSDYDAGALGWDTHGNSWRIDSPGTCLQQPTGVNHRSWYVGTSNCQYGISTPTGALDLDSPAMSLPHGAILTFAYFREVRDEVGSAGNHDRFIVKVEDQAAVGTWTEIYFVDSSQVSWKKWVQSPAISLEVWANKSVKIRFEFDSVTTNASTTLRGIGISQVSVRRRPTVTLQETVYDETFSLSGNKPRGKPTTIKDYDEATGAPIFTRQLHYADANARLSDEVLSFDWDRDGAYQTLIDSYAYESRGDLWRQWLPHAQGTSARRYEYSRAFGALIGVTATDEGTGIVQNLIPMGTGDSILYNDAGGMSRVQFGNGLQQHIEPNAEFLPNRIWVDRGAETDKLWDTYQYLYDGARNIKQIGEGDFFRYDAAMRLTWAREASSVYNTVDLDQVYDAFGNMTAQNAARTGGGINGLPYGLTFSGRTYEDNKLASATYDLNGNLISEPAHDGLSAQRYSFTAESQLARIMPGLSESHPGASSQAALYEGGDHRWFRSVWGDGSKALITLRDASGQVVADFVESNASSGLKLEREYVRANGQLVAINSACGPRPELKYSNPLTVGTTVWFDKIDHVPPVGNYTIHVRTSDGQTKTISMPSAMGNHFAIGQNELFPNVQNWIQIEAEAECGSTGYSNAVSYIFDPNSPSCIRSTGIARLDFNGSGSKLKIQGVGNCSPTTTYNIYYVDPEAELSYLGPLNGSTPVADPSQLLENIPCGSGNGSYWIRPVSSVTHHETPGSPTLIMDGTSCGGGIDGNAMFVPGQPSMNAQYVHWDHLGSTRMLTDEYGVTIAAFKYYPFGYEAEFSGGSELRQKFTGHERDEAVGLDYMMARSCRMALGRFLEPDPYDGSIRPPLPQSWNRYAYVLNNPLNATDPAGYDAVDTKANFSSRNQADANGPVQVDRTQPDNSRTMSTLLKIDAGAAIATSAVDIVGASMTGVYDAMSGEFEVSAGKFSLTLSSEGLSLSVTRESGTQSETTINVLDQSVEQSFSTPEVRGVKGTLNVPSGKVSLQVDRRVLGVHIKGRLVGTPSEMVDHAVASATGAANRMLTRVEAALRDVLSDVHTNTMNPIDPENGPD